VIIQEEQYLAHYGVKGMKWGVRKAINKVGARIKTRQKQEKEYRKKLSNIENKAPVSAHMLSSDIARIKYRNHSLAYRVTSTATKLALGQVLSDAMSGKLSSYATMNKKDIAKKIGKLAAETAISVVTKDKLADSSAKKYNSEGKRTKKYHLIEKEDIMGEVISAVPSMIALGNFAVQMKYASAVKQRAANEERFKSWGGNILSEKASDYNNIWASDDGNTSILEKVR